MTRFAVIGGGTMPAKCLERMAQDQEAAVALVIIDPSRETGTSLEEAASDRGIPVICCDNSVDSHVDAALEMAEVDWLLSINNYMRLPASTLAIPRRGTINLHQSALPSYAGLNSCSWAILNGESEHGVTWHLVNRGLDSGDILAQRRFAIEADSTALSVLIDVMRHGLALFDELMPLLLTGDVQPQPQIGFRTYYSGRQLPFDGQFPVTASWKTLDRLSRAINFHPLPNMFFRPRLSIGGESLEIESFEVEQIISAQPPGTVLARFDDRVDVITADAVAHIHLSIR